MGLNFLSLTVLALAISAAPLSVGQRNVSKQIIEEIVSLRQQHLLEKIIKNHPTLDREALLAGMRAYNHLQIQEEIHKHILTIVNFNKPSNKKRLWVINMDSGNVLYSAYVAQGNNTGFLYAHHFSNQFNSHASSIGVYLTGQTYDGKKGYSLRLYGLDRGFNDHAYLRGVVVHSAWYVSAQFAKLHGYIGHSWGCFALDQKIEPKIVQTIKNGTVLVAYYPDPSWLHHSPYEQPMAV